MAYVNEKRIKDIESTLKKVDSKIGVLSSLETEDKENIVDAVNELASINGVRRNIANVPQDVSRKFTSLSSANAVDDLIVMYPNELKQMGVTAGSVLTASFDLYFEDFQEGTDPRVYFHCISSNTSGTGVYSNSLTNALNKNVDLSNIWQTTAGSIRVVVPFTITSTDLALNRFDVGFRVDYASGFFIIRNFKLEIGKGATDYQPYCKAEHRNLLLGTGHGIGEWKVAQSGGTLTLTDVDVDGLRGMRLNVTDAPSSGGYIIPYIELHDSWFSRLGLYAMKRRFHLSFWAKMYHDTNLTFRVYRNGYTLITINNAWTACNGDGVWHYYDIEMMINDTYNYLTDTDNMRIYLYGASIVNDITFHSFKLEEGSEATQWTDAPEDVAQSDKYLPLTGGTLEAVNSDTPLVLKGNTGSCYVTYKKNDGTILGHLGVTTSGLTYYKDGVYNSVFHSGNAKDVTVGYAEVLRPETAANWSDSDRILAFGVSGGNTVMYYDNKLKYNPYDGNLKATKFNGVDVAKCVEVFDVTYNSTTYADIYAAHQAKKHVRMKWGEKMYTFGGSFLANTDPLDFTSTIINRKNKICIYWARVDKDNNWTNGYKEIDYAS